jgi:hypothetical protein
VECLQRSGLGLYYSVAHYFESPAGDLVADPDVVFVRHADGSSPVSFQDSIAFRAAVHFHDDATIEVSLLLRVHLVEFSNHGPTLSATSNNKREPLDRADHSLFSG